MVVLPHRLIGRWRLLQAEVVALFAPIVSEIDGNLSADNFSRRAALRNAQKEAPALVCAVQCRVRTAVVPTTSGHNVQFCCPSPRRYVEAFSVDKTEDAWINTAIGFHYNEGGPITGTLYYGGTGTTGVHSLALAGAIADAQLLQVAGDFADPVSGNVHAFLDLNSGNDPVTLVLTAWFKTRHQR